MDNWFCQLNILVEIFFMTFMFSYYDGCDNSCNNTCQTKRQVLAAKNTSDIPKILKYLEPNN